MNGLRDLLKCSQTGQKFARFLGVSVLALGLGLAAPMPVQASNDYAEPDDIQKLADPEDPLSIVISLDDQRMEVYRGTALIETSRVSSGKRGYSTPTGIFSILQKNRHHRSNIYSGAPMPFMQRLTWSGIALHAGYVPNRPASHGCIRLPSAFASQLWRMTERGVHVIVNPARVVPIMVEHENLFQPQGRPVASGELRTGIRYASTSTTIEAPDPSMLMGDIETEMDRRATERVYSEKPLRILITLRTGRERLMDVQNLLNELGFDAGDVDGYMGSQTAQAVMAFQKSQGLRETGIVTDFIVRKLFSAAGRGLPMSGHIYVRQGFNNLFDAPMRIVRPYDELGTHIYTAMGFHPFDSETEWTALTAQPSAIGGPKEALDRVEIPEAIRRMIADRLTPGSSLIISDNGISNETTSFGSDFIVLTERAPSEK